MSTQSDGPGGGAVRVLVAHGHCLMREAITAAVSARDGFEVVHQASEASELNAEVLGSPQVAVIDADLVGGAVEATGRVRSEFPECEILIVGHAADDDVLYRAVLAGARGYISGADSLDTLVVALQALARGEALIPAQMLGGLLGRLAERRSETEEVRKVVDRLTSREREVLRLVTEGFDNSSIGESLVISPQTARTHVQNVLSKLGVHSRLEAAAFVLRNGVQDALSVA